MKRLLTAILLLLPAALFAQPGDETPGAYFSVNPAESKTGKPETRITKLELRPNSDRTYYVYAYNPLTKAQQNLIVVLSADRGGNQILAEGTLANLAPNERTLVKLAAKTAPPAAEKPADDKKPAPPAASALPDKLYLTVFQLAGDNTRKPLSLAEEITVDIVSLKKYLKIEAEPKPVKDKDEKIIGYDLIVKVSNDFGSNPTLKLPGDPAKVTLNLRKDKDLLPGLDTSMPREGTYEAVVAPGAKDVLLVAKNLKFTGSDLNGYFSINVDGVPNVLTNSIDFNGKSNPYNSGGYLLVRAPEFAVPGKPLAVGLEVFGEGLSKGSPQFSFFRADSGPAEIITRDTPWDQKTVFRIEKGDLVVKAEVKEWSVALDTSGVYGKRRLSFDIPGSGFTSAVHEITFDDSAPTGATFLEPPAKVLRGKKISLRAKADDKESGIKDDGVLFYLGDPPAEGKKPAKGMAAKGVFNKEKQTWSAEFDIPEGKGPVDATVRFTNGVGLIAEKSVEIAVEEPPAPKPKPTTATIEGTVIQGKDRPQKELSVELIDADGKKVDSTKTNDKGEFKFVEVKPGIYKVISTKPSDYAKAEKEVTVKAGDEAKMKLEILR